MSDTLQFEIIPVTPLQQNCTLLLCPATGNAALVDPGGDVEDIVAAIERHGARLEKIFLTHGHLDHVGGTVALRDRYGVPVEGPHPDDAFWIDGLPMQAQMFGFPPLPAFTPDRWLKGGDTVRFGQVELAVRHCPGHTPGHVVFFDAEAAWRWSATCCSPAPSAAPTCRAATTPTCCAPSREQLWPLGNDVRFIPGHGPMSTFGAERRSNPYVADSVLARG